MAFRKNVLQEDVILCELYVDTCDGPDNSDNESLERDSDVSATSSHKQLRSSVVVVISDSETRGVCPTTEPGISVIILTPMKIHSLVFSLEGRAWQEPEPSHVTGMALAHCILGKSLGVVCHRFPPPLDVPTLAARCLCPQRHERS